MHARTQDVSTQDVSTQIRTVGTATTVPAIAAFFPPNKTASATTKWKKQTSEAESKKKKILALPLS
jgi:hypothetical protein